MTKKTEIKRNIYLNLKSREEALDIFLNALNLTDVLKSESLPIDQALDRVTSGPVIARLSSPGYHTAAMDGIAVKSEITFGASPDTPFELELDDQAFDVNTGHQLPEGTDAVIMIEQVQLLEGNKVQIEAAAYPWQHVRKVGEDIVATEMVVPQNTRLGPYELGAIAASGHKTISVKAKPRVTIIPTGSELVSIADLDGEPAVGQLLEYNSITLKAMVERAGGTANVTDIVSDDYDSILTAAKNAASSGSDLVLINAGSSAGSEDYTSAVLAELGRVFVHGVTIMPGKPTILAEVMGRPVIGIPGYPVSAVISFEQFALPVLAILLGVSQTERPVVEVIPSQAFPSRLGLEEFLRVKMGRIDGRIVAVPLPRGAGSITTLTRAEGVIRIPADSEGVGTEDTVKAELLKPLESIENTLVAIGSHDNTLDVLADLIKRRDFSVSLSSGNVGSLGGLLSLKRGFSHLAGSHLLDEETGQYNVSYIKKHLAGIPARLVNLVSRQQGFIVPVGNPKDINTFEDLTKSSINFVNRQAGSGTRILLDYNLNQLGIDPDDIDGYERDEFSHMSVAVDVLSGRADVGLGIFAAAKALHLDFVPVTVEQYDLVILEKFWQDPKIQILLEVINSSEFKDAVTGMGGYGTEKTGQIVWTWNGEE